MMVFSNEMDDSYVEEDEDNTFSHPFIKWNYHYMIIDHFVIGLSVS